MRKLIFLVVLPLSLSRVSLAQQTFYFAQVGDGVAGTIIFTTTLIFVNTGEDTNVKVEFFLESGAPMTLTLGNLGTASVFNIPLKKGETISLQTSGTGTVQVGYARVMAGDGVGGTAVFTRVDGSTGAVLYEAGVPASTSLSEFTIFLDSLDNKNTGLAIVNTGPAAENPASIPADVFDTLLFELADKFNKIIATTIVTLAREGNSGDGIASLGQQPTHEGPPIKIAKFVNEIFDGQGLDMEGRVSVKGAQMAAVTLRTNDAPNPTLTAFPVVPGTPDGGAATGSFSLLPSGDVVVALHLPLEGPQAIGVIYRLYEGESVAQEVVRTIESQGPVTEAIALPRNGRRILVSRVSVQLIYVGSQLGTRFDLRCTSSARMGQRSPGSKRDLGPLLAWPV